MQLPEERLIGWLCIIRLAFESGETAFVPNEVQQQLMDRGWIEIADRPDWDGKHTSTISDKGAALSDLHAPEWGIDPVGAVDG